MTGIVKGYLSARVHIIVAPLLAGVFALACIYTFLPERANLTEATQYKTASDPQQPLTAASFEDSAMSWQLAHNHRQSSSKARGAKDLDGGGVCVLDINNDGWDDIFLIGGSGDHSYGGHKEWWGKGMINHGLWLNSQSNSFINITKTSNIITAGYPMGCAVADFDNNGYTDLLITHIGPNQLWMNQGDSTFINASATLPGNDFWSTGAAVYDANGDSYNDIYVGSLYRPGRNRNHLESSTVYTGDIEHTFAAEKQPPQANQLLINHGGKRFEDSAKQWGLENSAGRTRSALWSDVNEDNLVDLIVVNSDQTSNRLFLASSNGFHSSELALGLSANKSSYSAAIIESGAHQSAGIAIATGAGHLSALLRKKEHTVNHGLLMDEIEAIAPSLANRAEHSWSVLAEDFNNDGQQDLFFANGAKLPSDFSQHTATGQHNTVWLMPGDHKVPVIKPFPSAHASRGAASADFNHDGLVDIITNNNNGPAELLINQTPATTNWVGLSLATDNGSIYGSRVNIVGTQQEQSVLAKTSYLSQSSSSLRFLLETERSTVDVRVRWPEGTETLYKQIPTSAYSQLSRDGHIQSSTTNTDTVEFTHVKKLFVKLNIINKLTLLDAFDQRADENNRFNQLVIELYRHLSADQKSYWLASLIDAGSPISPTLINLALSSNRVEVIRQGIRHAKLAEDDDLTQKLVLLLTHNNPEIVCDAAHTLEHFFREEEAVIRSKYTAIPQLIRALESAQYASKPCLIDALAESETFRASQALLKLINSEQDSATKIAAINALTRIAQTSNVEALIKFQESNKDKQLKFALNKALNHLSGSTVAADRPVLPVSNTVTVDEDCTTATFDNFYAGLSNHDVMLDNDLEIIGCFTKANRSLPTPKTAVFNSLLNHQNELVWHLGLKLLEQLDSPIEADRLLVHIIKDNNTNLDKRIYAIKWAFEKNRPFLPHVLPQLTNSDNATLSSFARLLQNNPIAAVDLKKIDAIVRNENINANTRWALLDMMLNTGLYDLEAFAL